MPRSAARTVGCAVLLASVEVHAFLAKAPRSFAAPPRAVPRARAATRTPERLRLKDMSTPDSSQIVVAESSEPDTL